MSDWTDGIELWRPSRWHRFKWWAFRRLCGLWGHTMKEDGYYDSYTMESDSWWECTRCGWRES